MHSRPLRHATMATILGFAWLTQAQLAQAADHVLDNVNLDLGIFMLKAPKIEVKDTPLDRTAVMALFDANASESAVSRLSKLNAAQIVIPEIVLTQKIGTQEQNTAYRDVKLNGIVAGRIADGTFGSATSTTVDPTLGKIEGKLGLMKVAGIDITHLLRVMTEKAPAGEKPPMKPLYAFYEVDGYEMKLGALGSLTMGKMVGRDLAARQSAEPWGVLFTRLSEAAKNVKVDANKGKKKDEPFSETDRVMLLAIMSLMDDISFGSGEAHDLRMAMSMPPVGNKPAEKLDFGIKSMIMKMDGPTSEFRLDGVSTKAAGADVKVASYGFTGFSLSPMFKALGEVLAKPGADFDSIDPKKLIPTLGTMRIAGLEADVPQEAKRGRPAQPNIKFGVKLFELGAANQVNGIPTALRFKVDNLTAPVIDTGDNPGVKDLLAMGYKTLDLSALMDLEWLQGSSELAIKSLDVSAANMISLTSKGTLGNITKDVFSGDTALMQVAMLGATAKELSLTLRNSGFIEKVLANEAKKAGTKPEELQKQVAMMATVGLASILGPSDGAKQLAAALSRFAAKPGSLSVSAKTKSGSGLGLADVIAISDPSAIFEKLDVKATAE
ncbi:MAG: hypothetical protein ACRC56_07525 [Bosea sp. (in: a-proteobacteria)]